MGCISQELNGYKLKRYVFMYLIKLVIGRCLLEDIWSVQTVFMLFVLASWGDDHKEVIHM